MGRWIFAGLGVLTVLACGGVGTTEYAIDASDRAILIEASDVVHLFPGAAPDPSAETYLKKESFGSWEYSYTHENVDLMIFHSVFIEDRPEDAEWVMWGAGMAPALLESESITATDAPELLTFGDEKKCSTLATDGVQVGALCVVREDAVVMMLMIGGRPLNTPGAMDPFLRPVMTAAKTHTPVKTPLETP